jgi:hypothetical protein
MSNRADDRPTAPGHADHELRALVAGRAIEERIRAGQGVHSRELLDVDDHHSPWRATPVRRPPDAD